MPRLLCGRLGLTVNRNAIPFDKNGPWYTSGIRLGTAAVTTLGMGEEEMREIAAIIYDVVSHTRPSIAAKTGQPSKAQATTEPDLVQKSKKRVETLLQRFPLYPEIAVDFNA